MQKNSEHIVSVCFPDFEAGKQHFAFLENLTLKLSEKYNFWEIVVILDPLDEVNINHFTSLSENIRVFTTSKTESKYRKTVLAVQETLGDFVAIAYCTEIEAGINIFAMVQKASEIKMPVITLRKQKKPFLNFIDKVTKYFSAWSGFNVNFDRLKSAVFTRGQINEILKSPERELALRFSPRANIFNPEVLEFNIDTSVLRGGRILDRLVLFEQVLTSAALKILSLVILSSIFLSIISIGYLIYTLVVFLFAENIEPGWLTISIMISSIGAFLGSAFSGVGLALKALLLRLKIQGNEDCAFSLNTVNIFSTVKKELNVATIDRSYVEK